MKLGFALNLAALAALCVACGEDPTEASSQESDSEDTVAEGSSSDDDVGEEQGSGSSESADQGSSESADESTSESADGSTSESADDESASESADESTDESTEGESGSETEGETDTDTDTDTTDTGVDPCSTILYPTVRDFMIAHPDFEGTTGNDLGIVEDQLGADSKPVYAGNPNTPTTSGADNFNQWYNDVEGVNLPFEIPIELLEVSPGVYEYDNSAFFPIDDQGWGNEGNTHNYHFTLELHTSFQYQGGEVFTFRGDDDLWVFVNGKLGINLGGVHGALEGSIDMDAMAGDLGLELGGVYAIDFFFAERHTVQSNFKITTTISCFEPQ
ncbi:fibro-slime domain-containing protein [Pseudenhygromyxa sp. WMMC2535]|uniref:fibro-slime domain-containing protein n=1 Tax=Pseudenhygromyxa sp. WMMC2535 TaxID=2712867 RepID=UPI0015527BF5|nr:fibro-slime domain-containing protein [Pseudenhygromyxa sp. WMMC2535]NVB40767.1 fibro-slime domain-containing protein [Pseudenhygromyxa sp. WMMC2535]